MHISLQIPELKISYKPQQVTLERQGFVKKYLEDSLEGLIYDHDFKISVLRPLKIDELYDCELKNLSGGELQRVAIAQALRKNADLYLIDEPSAYLDSEQRLNVAKIIKSYILDKGKTAFIVEHDFIMATYLANQ